MLRFGQLYKREFNLPLKVAGKPFNCWHANTQANLTLGLMGHQLETGTGCLLDFGQPKHFGLWMKDCLHPLVALFADNDGRIICKALMNHKDPYASHSAPYPCRYALEIRPEDSNDIFVGDLIELDDASLS